jgi:hypothetical protein
MRSASPAQHPQCGAHRFPQLCNLISVQRTSSSSWVQARSPQRFIGKQVAEPGDAGLVHEPSLQWRVAIGQDRRELRERNIARIRAESLFVGIKFHSPKSTRISQSQCATTVEVHNESFPRRIFAMTRILKAIDGVDSVKFQDSCHSKTKSKRWAVIACVEQ